MYRKDWQRIALLALGAVGIGLLYVGNAAVTTLAIVLIGLVLSFLRSLPETYVEEPKQPKPGRRKVDTSLGEDTTLPSMHQLVTDAKRRRRD
jgi:hypothetical protein